MKRRKKYQNLFFLCWRQLLALCNIVVVTFVDDGLLPIALFFSFCINLLRERSFKRNRLLLQSAYALVESNHAKSNPFIIVLYFTNNRARLLKGCDSRQWRGSSYSTDPILPLKNIHNNKRVFPSTVEAESVAQLTYLYLTSTRHNIIRSQLLLLL